MDWTISLDVIPGRECNERTRNLEIPGSHL